MSSLVITNAGVQLMAKLAAGEATSTFTKLQLSSKQYSTGDLEGLTSLSDVKQEVTFSSINAVSTGTVKLTAVAENTSIKEGFTVNTLGLITTDGTNEILYAVIDISGEPDFQPAYDAESISRLSYAFTVQVGRAASVNLQVVAATTAMQISFDNKSAKEFESENVQDAIVEALTKAKEYSDDTTSISKLPSGIPSRSGVLPFAEGNATKKGAFGDLLNAIIPLGAAAHNAIYRGKSLGSSVTDDQYNAIDNGTFDDLFIGDYWTINSVIWRIAGFDYWLHTGDTECSKHHVVIVPDTSLANGPMNKTNIVTGAYIGSDFYTGANGNTAKATAKGLIVSAFGTGHILVHREFFANAVSDGYETAGSFYDSDVDLMNECMVYGAPHFHNRTQGTNFAYNHTIDKSQLPLFQHDHSRITNRSNWWLRDVTTSTAFACVFYNGVSTSYGVGIPLGIRPAFGIVKS